VLPQQCSLFQDHTHHWCHSAGEDPQSETRRLPRNHQCLSTSNWSLGQSVQSNMLSSDEINWSKNQKTNYNDYYGTIHLWYHNNVTSHSPAWCGIRPSQGGCSLCSLVLSRRKSSVYCMLTGSLDLEHTTFCCWVNQGNWTQRQRDAGQHVMRPTRGRPHNNHNFD